tara:strand:- start:347 stop:475 length:129 start_codon:yes stop_codon:yes gene_type:complete
MTAIAFAFIVVLILAVMILAMGIVDLHRRLLDVEGRVNGKDE